ncbi:multidrug ABC transporter ATP-binding protein [Ahniella affigens]|uniref:Multidrug ABC transporter ATP-binding protein n=1 Tax=Ahniella affigens TaxID=2021234 RepID=A0A2P1PVV3_9GAMM|nr:ABC transporter ATP-binding protein [Ahniella affigens]AVP98960.1 multidrug ABC transporter ATP-binding protein [Ahniella affigens]
MTDKSAAAMIDIRGIEKTYSNGFTALKPINLQIRRGELFALLGPNGAGKSTLINIICGVLNASRGQILIGGQDHVHEFRATRRRVGLVPQELHTDAFETVLATTRFSRGLFGMPANPDHVEKVLKDLSLWDKRNDKIMTLSGGMKRRVLIAKALAHEPDVLFLDEPTAGVDVELRHDMWQVIKRLRESGVTIILTTHYIEEAELMADRVGVILKGEIILVEDKRTLMKKLGKRQLILQLNQALTAVPETLADLPMELSADGLSLTCTFGTEGQTLEVPELMQRIHVAGLQYHDLATRESSLEEIFVDLVRAKA